MSKFKNILFRVDSSSDIGLGHIMRDLVFASQYEDCNITFASQDLKGNINHRILENGYNLEILKSNSKKELIKLIKKLHINLLVIDHYGFDYKKEKYIKEKTGVKILSFDDTYEKHYCDILLNHNIGANSSSYKNLVPKDCELRCGSKYTLLREEFYKQKYKIQRTKNSKIKTIFVAIGGTDHTNINQEILKVLSKFSNIKVNLITTSSNKNLTELTEYVEDKKWIKLHVDSTKIAKLMSKSDFAIITPSVTANEIYFMELPFIVIKTASNQKYIYNYLENKQYKTLKNFNKLELLFQAWLLIKKINLKNFTSLSNEESIEVLKMRNNKNVRKWMYSTNKIGYREHTKYIKLLKSKKDKIYFLITKYEKNIGIVDFINIKYNKEAEIGIYSNPDLKGQGNLLMNIILSYGFIILKLKKIKANVLVDNILAINLYERFNFIKIRKNNNILYMELKRENYV